MFERSATGDDVVPCPDCAADGDVRVRFHTGDQTDVFCAKCGKSFSAEASRWAYADWNWWAIERWQAKGVAKDIAPLYALLKEEADLQRTNEAQQRHLAQKIEASLKQFVDCPWDVGSRFQSTAHPVGFWEVTGVERIYATNTGPMWLVHAAKVKPSGFVDEGLHTFAGRDADQMEPLAPFWPAASWAQVMVGDECVYNSTHGVVTAVDRPKRRATINFDDGAEVEARNLRLLHVPISRFKSHAT